MVTNGKGFCSKGLAVPTNTVIFLHGEVGSHAKAPELPDLVKSNGCFACVPYASLRRPLGVH